MKKPWILLFLFLGASTAFAQQPPVPTETPKMRRIANIYVAETFINEQIKKYAGKSELFKDLRLNLDAKTDHLYLSGRLLLPMEELQTMGLDRSQGDFRFQLTIRPRATKSGHLRLEFPISETYFHLASSKNPQRDRVVVPVHLLSLALASARGYLSALSGDFSTFDKKSAKVKSELRAVKKLIAAEKDPEAVIDLKLKKRTLELQLETIPVERAKLERTAKGLTNILSFMGEKELNLNEEIMADENSLTLKIKLGKIVPYLKDIELSGIRVSHDARDGDGEDYLVVGVDSALEVLPTPTAREKRKPREGRKIPPSMLMRINQSVFNSKTVVAAQKENFGASITDFDVSLKDDGVHVTGKWKKYFITIPFDTTVDFVTTGPDVFEVRLRKLNVRGIDMKFLTSYVLDTIKQRLDKAFAGICTFSYLGEDKDESHVLQVTVEPKKLVPAFPDLHLVEVDVGNREFILKIGHIEGEVHEAGK